MVSKLTTFGNKKSHMVNCSLIFVLDMGTHGYTCEYPQWPGSCIYSRVPTDPQVFDSRLWVIRGKKSSQIWVWHLAPKIPVGTDPGHPQVHSCSALDIASQLYSKLGHIEKHFRSGYCPYIHEHLNWAWTESFKGRFRRRVLHKSRHEREQ